MEESNLNGIVSQLKAIIGVKMSKSTLRRWASEELIPKPKIEEIGSKDRLWVWPQETVEQAAIIYTLRNKDLPWGKTTSGWPRTKKGDYATISTQMLLEVKKMVDHLYASIDEGLITFTVFFEILDSQKDKLDIEGRFNFGSVRSRVGGVKQPVYIAWVTTKEKIRHNKPLSEPLEVVFHWQSVHFVADNGNKSKKLKFCGISVESSGVESVRHVLNNRKVEQQFKESAY